MELITTPAKHNSNSYISLTEAESYFTTYDKIASSDPWNDLSDDKKKYALVLAAQAINTFNFKGKKVVENQALAFPRFSKRQVRNDEVEQFRDFFQATRSENLYKIIDGGDISISNNQLVDNSSSQDAFFKPLSEGNLYYNQIVKQEGLSVDTYLTITDIELDGSKATVKEDISDESAPSGGVTVYSTPLFGFPDEVGYAQAEMAYQFISSTLFQAEANQLPGLMPKSWDLGGNLSVTYMDRLMGNSKFSPDQSSPIQIVYLFLGSWLTSIKGTVV